MTTGTAEFLSLLAFLAVQIATTAFLLGGLFQRVRSLTERVRHIEEAGGDGDGRHALLRDSLTRLETKFEGEMKHLGERFGELRTDLTWLRQTALYELEQTPGGVRRRDARALKGDPA